jgi:hypothetical protein
MLVKYSEWITKNITEAYGKCKEMAEEMAKIFPELTIVRGHYYCMVWGEREHWWLVDEQGHIVDPTAAQFPTKGNGEYVPWDEGAPEPTGMCPNCGEYCYDGNYCCSESCSISYAAYCMNPY